MNTEVRYVEKRSSRLMRTIDWVLRKTRLNNHFMGYWTTIGRTVYLPDYIDIRSSTWKKRYIIMRCHELVHAHQFRKYGIVLMALMYFLFPLPVLLAYGRWRLEREAYSINIAASPSKAIKIEWVVQDLWSNYGYPWPRFLMRRYFCQKFNIPVDEVKSLHLR